MLPLPYAYSLLAETTNPKNRWHYILTGPPSTPYHTGQYWGTLSFPRDYPFSPPAIRMHTPSGRFQPSTRLCLSISDFHPKSFNPAWSVSTILIGLLSFMTGDEMTTGSVGAGDSERRLLAAKSRWWNSTGGGSRKVVPGAVTAGAGGRVGVAAGAGVKAGDGGVKFRSEWRELDLENCAWMAQHRIDPISGLIVPDPDDSTGTSAACSPETAALRRRLGGSGGVGSVVQEGRAVRDAGGSWVRRNKWWVLGGVVFVWVLVGRALGGEL